MIKRISIFGAAAGITWVLAMSSAASGAVMPLAADPQYDWSFVGTDSFGTTTASGILSVTGGVATSGSGTITTPTGDLGLTNAPITLFPNPSPPAAATSPDGLWVFDNLVPLTGNGLLFTGGAGLEFSVYAPNGWGLSSNGAYVSLNNTTGTFTATAVPEPATWAMMLFGFAGLGLATLRRARAVRTIGEPQRS